MRQVAAILVICACCLGTFAQTSPKFAYIALPQVEARAGRSLDPKIYPTNLLRFRETIEVIEEKDGWVGIKPPPGSFSWIDRAMVDPVAGSNTNYTVTGAKSVPTRIGSAINGETMPTIEGVSLPKGSQVLSFWAPLKEGDKQWLKIEPPEGEVRWLPRDAVGGLPSAPSPPPTTAGTVSSPGGTVPGMLASGSGAFPQASSAIQPPITRPAPQDLWNQAGQAKASGKTAEALRIYTQIAQDYATTHPDWARAASREAESLRNPGMTTSLSNPPPPYGVGPVTQPFNYSPYSPCAPLPPNTPWTPLYPVPQGGYPVMQPYYVQPYPTQPVMVQPQQPQVAQPSSLSGGGRIAGQGLPRGQGYVRRSGRFVDKRPVYTLETIEGRPVFYLLPTQGVSLEPYMDHKVEVSGGTYYNPETRAEILYVQQIRLLPQ